MVLANEYFLNLANRRNEAILLFMYPIGWIANVGGDCTRIHQEDCHGRIFWRCFKRRLFV